MANRIVRRRPAVRMRRVALQQLLGQQSRVFEKRRQILRDNFPTAVSGVVDDEEQSLDAEERAIAFSVLEFTSRTLQGMETALERLATGDSGICSACRSRISEARLRALPFAALCLACQEQNDVAAVAVPGTATDGWRQRVAATRLSSFGH